MDTGGSRLSAVFDALFAGDPDSAVRNAFCPTGQGGGVDPTCSPGGAPAAPASPPLSEKAQRAKAAYKAADKSVQRYAEERSEPRFARAMGGRSLPDSEPVDVVTAAGHGVELKTMVDNKNNKITMDKYAQVRKIVWEQRNATVFHTVVSDDSKVFNAKGEGQHGPASDRVYYYRRGVAGSANVGAMHKVASVAELKRLMAAPESSLPPAARRTDAHLREGTWKYFEKRSKEGKVTDRGYANTVTKETVRPKK